MPVGNRAPIGPPDNRSASSRPIRGGGYRSGAFGVGLQRSSRRTLGPRAAQPPLRARARSLERCSCARARRLPSDQVPAAQSEEGRGRPAEARRRGRGTARKPLTKQLWEGREASASSLHRSAMLPVTVHRWSWPMTWREGARVGGRARGSASVGLVRGKGFSCHLRRRAKRDGGGEEPKKKRKRKLYLRDTWSALGGVCLTLGGDGNFCTRGRRKEKTLP